MRWSTWLYLQRRGIEIPRSVSQRDLKTVQFCDVKRTSVKQWDLKLLVYSISWSYLGHIASCLLVGGFNHVQPIHEKKYLNSCNTLTISLNHTKSSSTTFFSGKTCLKPAKSWSSLSVGRILSVCSPTFGKSMGQWGNSSRWRWKLRSVNKDWNHPLQSNKHVSYLQDPTRGSMAKMHYMQTQTLSI